MSLPGANAKADVLAVRKTVRRRSYHQFIGEGDAVNYLARQRDNEYAVTGNRVQTLFGVCRAGGVGTLVLLITAGSLPVTPHTPSRRSHPSTRGSDTMT
jgi:hypothetical protein